MIYRTVAALLLGLILLPITSVRADTRLAPADEYFGPMHMSPIEISNRIKDAEQASPNLSLLLFTQAAIEDWTNRYPSDTWIPEREYRLAHLFAQAGTEEATSMAQWCRTFLEKHFPNNRFTLQAHQELGDGNGP